MRRNEESCQSQGERMVDAAKVLLLRAIDLHAKECPDPDNCQEIANTLGYLAHCTGATQKDLLLLPKMVLRHDMNCAAKHVPGTLMESRC